MPSFTQTLDLARSGSAYPERADPREGGWDRWARACWRLLEPLDRQDQMLRRRVQQAVDRAAETRALDEPQLLQQLRRSARRGWVDASALPQALACVRELCRRSLQMEPYPAQLLGAAGLLTGRLVEMQTGEGKSLTAALAATLAAAAGVPVHVVTVNDYLAQRDAEEMAPLFARAGLTVGAIVTGMSVTQRRHAYAQAICYCTGKELVFDYLKDRSAFGANVSATRQQLRAWVSHSQAEQSLLRGLHFAIVDEADSIFIDEARTPLILAVKAGAEAVAPHFAQALQIARTLEPQQHYLVDARRRSIALTALGRQQALLASAALGPAASAEWQVRIAREHWVLQALRALHLFIKDHHYVVRADKVEIVDENTGRVLEGRTWEQGLHQMIETKEGCALSDRARTMSRITYQRFFARYLRLSGMTGTAREVRGEIRACYGLRTLVVPTHRPSARQRWADIVLPDTPAKWQRIAQEVQALVAQQRAVLVGTGSVEASEALSAVLQARGVAHRVLNAQQDAAEAELVRSAGLPGTVTVATNMAGRGTDIKLPPEVLGCGGLHVILSEHHESSRVDRQLFGRAGRQGDVGSAQCIVALDDALFTEFAPALAQLARGLHHAGLRRVALRLARGLAQHRAERQHRATRREALRHDNQLADLMAMSGRL
ncbi:DEAD/DEAH box helicase [Pseudorhodoferax sp. Leaf267]|uniref:preprotein translocase subunit SecA n=1 Tax=Pseudorhodoferax sp. Leaf267 TaxID=1736316 RepID=UPI0006F256D7|nr:DEAD/DEAH box helicase [Pseudorhodoferax sp. Leaf267]KQP11833.1 hypothetical protein ASF43_23040 [Pseudorhodoferax sp. Leaf267]